MSRAPKTVLVLGGGVGGVAAARRLRARLPRHDHVVLVDRAPMHLFQSSLLWLLNGARRADEIQRPLAALRRAGIDVVTGAVERIDVAGRSAVVDGRELRGDALLIALGAQLAPERIPGLSDAGHDLYTLEGAGAAHDALRAFAGGRVALLTAAPAYKCPAAPYEAAMLVRDWLNRHGRADARVDLYAAEAGPMLTAGPDVSAGVRALVEQAGVGYHPGRQVESVDAPRRVLSFAGGEHAEYDLLLYVPPHRAPDVVVAAGLTGASGWVDVDAHTLRTRFDGVWAIGDATGIPLPNGKMLPKSGVFAHREAYVVADDIAAGWSGRAPKKTFDGRGACFIEAGGGRAGYGAGDFYAEPAPVMRLRAPSRVLHAGKVAFEKYWFWRYLRA